MNQFKKRVIPALVAASALAIAGCGGGGSGGGETPKDTSTKQATVNGVVSKGIIKGGQATAYEVGADGKDIRTLGSAVTADDGSYSITVNPAYGGGPVRVEITTTANSEMKCDIVAGCGNRNDGLTDSNGNSVVDFGEWYKPGTFTMNAVVASLGGSDKIAVSVTPFTDLAARRAMSNPVFNAAAINTANSEVSTLLGGINILEEKPVDITNSSSVNGATPAALSYASLSAAIATQASRDTNGTPNIGTVLNTLANSFTNGSMAADDSGSTNNANIISLKELLDGAKDAYTAIGKTDTSGTLTALESDVNSAIDIDGDGVKDIPLESSPTASAEPLAKVKAFVSDMRTWGNLITDELKDKSDAFSLQEALAADAADMSRSFIMAPALETAISAAVQKFEGNPEGDLANYGLGFSSGSITMVNGVITITDGVLGDVTVDMTIVTPADGTTSSEFEMGIASATLNSNTLDAKINKGVVNISLPTPYHIDLAAMSGGTAPEIPMPTRVGLDLDLSMTQKRDIMDQPLAHPVTYAGKLSTAIVVHPDATGEIDWLIPSTIALEGEVASGGNSLKASIAVNVANAATFTPVVTENTYTYYQYNSTFTELPNALTWSITDNDEIPGSDTVTLIYASGESYSHYWSTIDGTVITTCTGENGESCAYPSTYAPSLEDMMAWIYANTAWRSGAYINGDWYYIKTSDLDLSQTSGSLSGTHYESTTIPITETYLDRNEGSGTNQWIQVSLGMHFNLKLAGAPEAMVSVTGNRTGFKDGNAEVKIAYGNRNIVIKGQAVAGEVVEGSVAITNQDGVVLTVLPNADRRTGRIQYNGVTYANIEKLSNGIVKITYSDGQFESIQ